MKCNNCGFENEQDFQYCPSCGCQAAAESAPRNPAADKILSALKDKLFLVICILMSASCLLSLTNGDLPLISVLSTIFLWLTYAQSLKDIADPKHLRSVSGTVFAQYVINYVLAGLMLLLGIICAAAFTFIVADPGLLESILSEFMDTAELYSIAPELSASAPIAGGAIFVVFVVIAAVIVVLNLFSQRYIHRFAKSVYQSVEVQTLKLENVNTVRIWLFVYAAFSAIGALSSLAGEAPVSGLAAGCICAAEIISGILIGKYLLPEK